MPKIKIFNNNKINLIIKTLIVVIAKMKKVFLKKIIIKIIKALMAVIAKMNKVFLFRDGPKNKQIIIKK